MNSLLSAGLGMAFGFATAIAAAVLLTSCGAKVTGRPFDPASPSFPTTEGESLNRRKFTVPRDFDAPFNIVIVAFYQEQQPDCDTWLPTARDIAADHANVEYYELPTISGSWTIAKGWIDGGMRSGIPAFAGRERTVTLFTDTEKFRELAGIDGPKQIWVGIVDREGKVYWSTRGPATEDSKRELRSVVVDVAAPGSKGL
jgi:hypothetical protein